MELSAKEIANVILKRDARDVVTSFHPAGRGIKFTAAKRKWHDEHQETHQHKLELHLVLSGHSESAINGKLYHLEPGTIFMVNNGESHDFGQWGENRGLFLYLIIYEHGILWFDLEVLPDSGHKPVMTSRHIQTNFDMIDRFREAWAKASSSKGFAQELAFKEMTAYLELIFMDAAKFYLEKGFAEIQPMPPKRIAIQQAMEILNASYGRNLNIRQLAAKVGYSPSRFQLLFKQVTGKTIHEYIDDLRIEYFRLHVKNEQQKYMADFLGFKSLSAFSRWKKIKGVEA